MCVSHLSVVRFNANSNDNGIFVADLKATTCGIIKLLHGFSKYSKNVLIWLSLFERDNFYDQTSVGFLNFISG